MKNKCDCCKHNVDEIFVHCKECLINGKKSSDMRVVIFEDHTEIYCVNCGRPVTSSNQKFKYKNLSEVEGK